MKGVSVKLHGWMEIVRPPNLFTIPGDILAGALLSGITLIQWPSLIIIIICSLFLYAAGLILNDYFDRENDKEERPDRPLPSGRVNAPSALFGSVALFVFAGLLGFFLNDSVFTFPLTVTIIVLIIIYNCFARRVPIPGFIVMGLCRGFNLLLGASVGTGAFTPIVIGAAGLETVYITILTVVAFHEIKFKNVKLIEQMIRGLIFLQIFFVFIAMLKSGGNPVKYIIVIFIMIVLFYISKLFAKKYYGS